MARRTLYGTVIVTYRCNAKCNMCDCWRDPSRPEEEIQMDTIKKLPEMAFTNITGGEPFIRRDLPEIVEELYKKTDRIVISTNGYFTDRIIALCKQFPKIGIRISIEGMQATNDAIRRIPDGWNRGYETLKTLVEMGHPDVGFGLTVQDMNCEDLVPLYKLSDEMGMEFATATLHNSFYFRKTDNKIDDKYHVAQNFEALINELLQSKSPKKWFRAYFNHGLRQQAAAALRYVQGCLLHRPLLRRDSLQRHGKKGRDGKLEGKPGLGYPVEQRTGQNRARPDQAVRPQLLDDRQRVPGHAQVHLGARLVGGEAQVPQGRQIQPERERLHSRSAEEVTR